MATKKKMLQAAAGNAGGGAGGLDVESVFSTYLYTGNDASKTITNGIDLDGEGGLVWIKQRDGSTQRHVLSDTERGTSKTLSSDRTDAEFTSTTRVTSFNSDGFDLGSSSQVNGDPSNYASWTFRKAPKFCDIVTYTGDGNDNRTVNHNLGSSPGMVIVKKTDAADSWIVWHRSVPTGYLSLNVTSGLQNYTSRIKSANDTTFTLGTSGQTNSSGANYVAYVFAHNDGDGEFGPDGDADIIKCGSYTGNESSFPIIDLGFEPQFLMIKSATSAEDWLFMDTMRGWLTDGNNPNGDFKVLRPNTANGDGGSFGVNITSTGFELTSASADKNSNGNTFIYMAIRRGTKVPESATEVFDVDTRTSGLPSFKAPFAVDMGLVRKGTNTSGATYNANRLTGTKFLYTYTTDAEANDSGFVWDFMDGWANDGVANSTVISWMWKRAPKYFDVVAYSGDSYSNRDVTHNLTVKPELVITKKRNSSGNWEVAAKITNTNYHGGLLNSSGSLVNTSLNVSGNAYSQFSDNHFQVGGTLNSSGDTYIAYLFASLDGISKVGSYTADGSAQNIDCGFTSGARFVLIKRTDTGGNWFVLDTVRGIVSGNDPLLELNSTSAEDNGYDNMDPYSAGFTITAYGGTSPYLNISGGEYIFYAIA